MLIVDRVNCYLGGGHVLKDVSLSLAAGEVLGLLGRNGVGKTTTLRTIMGLVRPRSGRITLDGRDLTRVRAHDISRLGIAYVPQGRRLFPALTVEENLKVGLLAGGQEDGTREWVLELLPRLKERLGQRAGTLSGGEQQMLAIARALCADPRFLLMDEPTEGLMPGLTQRVLEIVGTLKARSVGVLLVEQKVEAALNVADRVVLMDNGTIRHQATPQELAANREMLLRHVGVKR